MKTYALFALLLIGCTGTTGQVPINQDAGSCYQDQGNSAVCQDSYFPSVIYCPSGNNDRGDCVKAATSNYWCCLTPTVRSCPLGFSFSDKNISCTCEVDAGGYGCTCDADAGGYICY